MIPRDACANGARGPEEPPSLIAHAHPPLVEALFRYSKPNTKPCARKIPNFPLPNVSGFTFNKLCFVDLQSGAAGN